VLIIRDEELPQILRWLTGLGLKVKRVRREGGETIIEIVLKG
jgi:hypothetical protein